MTKTTFDFPEREPSFWLIMLSDPEYLAAAFAQIVLNYDA